MLSLAMGPANGENVMSKSQVSDEKYEQVISACSVRVFMIRPSTTRNCICSHLYKEVFVVIVFKGQAERVFY